MPDYETAVICERGHIIDGHRSLKEKHGDDSPPDAFCAQCGAPSMLACRNCKTTLRGDERMHMSWRAIEQPYPFCHGCGEALPWTEIALREVEEVARDEGGLSDEETEAYVDAWRTLYRAPDESGHAEAAASRIKRLGAKLGGDAYGITVRVAGDLLSAWSRGQLG